MKSYKNIEIRITASLQNKSGVEILMGDCGPRSKWKLPLREMIEELIERMIDEYGETISEGKCKLIIRVEDNLSHEWIKRREQRYEFK